MKSGSAGRPVHGTSTVRKSRLSTSNPMCWARFRSRSQAGEGPRAFRWGVDSLTAFCDPFSVVTSQPEAEVPRPALAARMVRDERLFAGFRFLLRAAVALPMIGSGIARLIPVQMPPLRPLDQLQRLYES